MSMSILEQEETFHNEHHSRHNINRNFHLVQDKMKFNKLCNYHLIFDTSKCIF